MSAHAHLRPTFAGEEGWGGSALASSPADRVPSSVPSCVPFSIYTPWGKRCEQLSMKLGAFFGILFGTLGAILLLGVAVFVILRFWGSRARLSYRLDSES